jgi:hypothetical protein
MFRNSIKMYEVFTVFIRITVFMYVYSIYIWTVNVYARRLSNGHHYGVGLRAYIVYMILPRAGQFPCSTVVKTY